MQIHVRAAVYLPEGAENIYDLARDHFGIVATIERMNSTGAVLTAVADGSATLGVLPGFSMTSARWWPQLVSDKIGLAPRIIARLPFYQTGTSAGITGFTGDAVIVAGQEPEPSGDDKTLFAVRKGLGVAGTVIDEGDDFQLIELDGFSISRAGWSIIVSLAKARCLIIVSALTLTPVHVG